MLKKILAATGYVLFATLFPVLPLLWLGGHMRSKGLGEPYPSWRETLRTLVPNK